MALLVLFPRSGSRHRPPRRRCNTHFHAPSAQGRGLLRSARPLDPASRFLHRIVHRPSTVGTDFLVRIAHWTVSALGTHTMVPGTPAANGVFAFFLGSSWSLALAVSWSV